MAKRGTVTRRRFLFLKFMGKYPLAEAMRRSRLSVSDFVRAKEKDKRFTKRLDALEKATKTLKQLSFLDVLGEGAEGDEVRIRELAGVGRMVRKE